MDDQVKEENCEKRNSSVSQHGCLDSIDENLVMVISFLPSHSSPRPVCPFFMHIEENPTNDWVLALNFSGLLVAKNGLGMVARRWSPDKPSPFGVHRIQSRRFSHRFCIETQTYAELHGYSVETKKPTAFKPLVGADQHA